MKTAQLPSPCCTSKLMPRFVVVKVSEAGEKVTFVLLLDGVTVTDCVGWVFSFAV